VNPVVELIDLNFAYNGTKILKNVNLVINQGDATCVVGPNGGGKSTLIKLVLGLLTPNSGKIELLGGVPEEQRSQVGYVPQYADFDPMFPVTVLDVALMGRLAASKGFSLGFRYSREDKKAAMNALDEMGMVHLAGSIFSKLSGGQRQRVLIARALVSASRMLILDEPTANIDAKVEGSLFATLTELNKKMTIILVTHDLGFASQFFRSVICVNQEVHVHPTSEISGEVIQDLYGADISMIRHDHRCTPGGHIHE
jgi:zinc transport system ATP-binding protein